MILDNLDDGGKTASSSSITHYGTNGEQITGNRIVVLQKNDENIVGRSRNQRGGLTKSWNGAEDYENHKEETD